VVANKGMLWARFGEKVVVTTHFCFVNDDGGKQRKLQQIQLAALVTRLFDGNATVTHVVVAGDFNHCLDSQTLAPGEAAPTLQRLVEEWGVTHSPSIYTAAWLPHHAAIEGLLETLACGGSMQVERLSSNDPTNEDGTVDHIIFVSKSGSSSKAAVKHIEVTPDKRCDYSDHLMLSAAISLS